MAGARGGVRWAGVGVRVLYLEWSGSDKDRKEFRGISAQPVQRGRNRTLPLSVARFAFADKTKPNAAATKRDWVLATC